MILKKPMTTKISYASLSFLICALALGGCSDAKEKLGLTRTPPDEFAVVKRAPLALPPEYTLRPPQPGAPRPQEVATEEQAREVIFGAEATQKTKPDNGEEALLQEAGSASAQPDIRQVVDRETAALAPAEKPVAEKLLGLGGFGGKDKPPASVVDAKAETERLRKNAEEGKPLSEGETPTVEE